MDNNTMQLLRSITPYNIKSYLNGKGWVIKEFPREDVWLFEDSKAVEQILIPKDNDYDLYAEDIFQVVKQLQYIECRNIEQITTQLQRPDVDIISYRIQSQQTETGALPLNAVKSFIDSIIDSFKASLFDCVKPNLHHSRMGGTRLEQLLEQAQFGQTEHGSYVVKIIAPAIQEEQSPLFSHENDTRKGIGHLLEGIGEIIQTINCGNVEQIERFIADNQNNPTISDNFVNALADMQLYDDASVEITVDWSPLLSPPPISTVMIKPEYFRSISAIGSRLSPLPEDRPAEFFTGFITQLDGNPNENGKPEGDVRIDILTHSQGERVVFAVLNHNDYQIAIDAHRDTIPVFFSGKLIRKSSRRQEIADIKDFKLSNAR